MKSPNQVAYGTFGHRDIESQNLVPRKQQKNTGIYGTLKLLTLFSLWYALNVMYNIDNKNALNMVPLPWTVSTLQLITGWFFFGFAWLTGMRPIPACHSWKIFFLKVFPQGIFHLMVHIGAVISLGAGAVSFTHIVKAGEPVVTALLSGLILNQYFSIFTYLSLVPVVLGVGLASLKELTFTWMSFWCAMISNLGSSGRGVFAKMAMTDKNAVGKNLSPSNMYALLTIVATAISIPLALIAEGSIAVEVWNQSMLEKNLTSSDIMWKIVLSGIWYYTYNEVAYLCLDEVNQVTHAVANTLKRVVIIVSSIIVFSTPLTPLGAIGSSIAIIGTFLYSVSKSKFG